MRMPDFLVLTLVAPMGAFGDLAGHERRGSHGLPGRGAILGLLGAAQGVRRDDAEGQAALSTWRMAVAQLLPGTPLRDFHTAQAVPSARIKRPDSRRHALSRLTHADNPIVTQRDYVTDCAFAVAFRGGDLETARDALLRPRFALYLGRKSCPLSAPMAPRIVDAPNAMAALRKAVLPPFAWRSPAPNPSRPILIASDAPIDGARQETRWDDPIDRTRWHFGPRTVHIYALAAQSDSGA